MAKGPKETDIDAAAIRKLAGLLDETGLGEIEIETEGWTIRAAKGNTVMQPAAPAAPQAPTPEAAPAAVGDDLSKHPGAVTSPMVGVTYLSPDPDSPDFVKVGDTVSAGQTLLLIEAMKVFNPITAPKAGNVLQILVESGEPVEFGAALMIIE